MADDDKSIFNGVTDYAQAIKEVSNAVHRLDKRFGRKNMRILLAYNCTFGGRVRGMETRMKYVDEVLDNLLKADKEQSNGK